MSTIKQYILIGVGALLVSGCSLWRPYERTMQVPQGVVGDVTTTTDTLPHWQTFFTDPYLHQYLSHFISACTDVQKAQLRIEQAEASLKSARLAYFPAVSMPLSGTLQRLDGVGSKDYALSVVASWQLDIFGSITNTKRKAKAQVEYQKDLLQATRCQLIATMATTYYQLLMLDQKLIVAKQMQKICEESLGTMQSLFERGTYMSTALSQQRAQLASVKLQILDIEHEIHTQENAFCLLLEEVPHTVQRGSLSTTRLNDAFLSGVPLDILRNRPDVRSAERTLESAYYGVQIARANLYPNVSIEGTAGWLYPGQWLFKGLASLTQPIFQQGKLRAAVKVAQADQQIACLNFEDAIRKAGNEVNTAFYDYKTTLAKTSLIDEQVSQIRATYDANQELMKNGKVTYLEVLTAQNDLFNAQLSQLENAYAKATAIVNLYEALGGN